VKRSILTIALISVCLLTGWFAHRFYSYDPHNGIQWRFTDAAQRGNWRDLERLHSKGAQINAVPVAEGGNLSGISALAGAAMYGQPEATDWLIRHGANPNQMDIDVTPLDFALHRLAETQKTIEILRRHGAKSQ
jgi:hypothetical protein